MIAVTATPMPRNGPLDMVPLLTVINMMSDRIMEDPDFHRLSGADHFERLCGDYRKMRWLQIRGEADALLEQDVRERVGALHAAYTIQRRDDTIQNNKSLLRIAPLEMYDVPCPSPEIRDRCRIWQVEEFLKSNIADSQDRDATTDFAQLLNYCIKPRILADVPGLVFYEDRKVLNWYRIREQGWHVRPMESPFAADFDKLQKSSGKLQMLSYILANLGHHMDGGQEKLVVVTSFPVVCLLVLIVGCFTGCFWRLRLY